jgi:hypothetical protein
MKTHFTFGSLILIAALLASGCAQKRSISNSSYVENQGYWCPPGRTGDYAYRGELSEFDVLGIEMSNNATDEQIARMLDASGRVSVRKGSSVLLIQSGAMQPDQPMVAALEKQFVIVPFCGQPGAKSAAGYSRSLRLAAAQAGCETVICYWGSLESASKGNETKAVSWVPLAGWILPDESQQMRIHLKVALVDVRSGRWTMLSSQAFEDRAHSNRLNREASDQKQVEKLKQLAYASAAADVVKIYAR